MNEGLQKGFLKHVFGILPISGNSIGCQEDFVRVAIPKLGEGPMFAHLRCCDKHLVVRIIEDVLSTRRTPSRPTWLRRTESLPQLPAAPPLFQMQGTNPSYESAPGWLEFRKPKLQAIQAPVNPDLYSRQSCVVLPVLPQYGHAASRRIPAGSDSSENGPVGKRGKWFSQGYSKARSLTQPKPPVIRKAILFLPTVEPDL